MKLKLCRSTQKLWLWAFCPPIICLVRILLPFFMVSHLLGLVFLYLKFSFFQYNISFLFFTCVWLLVHPLRIIVYDFDLIFSFFKWSSPLVCCRIRSCIARPLFFFLSASLFSPEHQRVDIHSVVSQSLPYPLSCSYPWQEFLLWFTHHLLLISYNCTMTTATHTSISCMKSVSDYSQATSL